MALTRVLAAIALVLLAATPTNARDCTGDACAAGAEEEEAAMLQVNSGAHLDKTNATGGSVPVGGKCGRCEENGYTYPSCSSGLVCKAPIGGDTGCSTCQKLNSGAQEGQKCGGTDDGDIYPDCAVGLYCMLPEDPQEWDHSTCVKPCNTGSNACSPGRTCACNTGGLIYCC